MAIALSFVDDSASARADRDITAGGAVSLVALADGASEAKATASSAGTDKTKEESGGNKSADDQANSATGLAKQQSGESSLKVGKSASTDDGEAGTSEDGAVSVGAALGLNVAWSSAEASVGAVQIISGGALELKAENNMDASALGDGSASTNKDGTAVGIGIAINVGFMDTSALVESGATIDAEGFKAEALMKDVSGDTTHKFGASATSGASGGDTGVAGSFALNYDETDTEAGIAAGASVDAGAGNVVVSAANTTEATVEAKSKAAGADTGAGVSVGINIAGNNATRALVDGTLSGGADVTLSATGSHKLDTLAQGGGKAADGTGVGGALALTVAMNDDTEASLGADLTGLNITGAYTAQAAHHGVASTLADGQASGSDAAVGVAIALSFVDDSASARADRDITAGGAVSRWRWPTVRARRRRRRPRRARTRQKKRAAGTRAPMTRRTRPRAWPSSNRARAA